MKLCIVIAYYITSITKELKFLNSHCSIVCSYCSVVCLVAKNELKMIKFFSSFKLNKIHKADSLFNEDPNNIIFFQGGPNFGEGRPENSGKMGNNRDNYCYANRGVVNFKREHQPLPPVTKILVLLQFSYMPDQISGKKWKNSIFRPNFDLSLGSSPPKIQGRIQKFFIWPNVFG